MDAKQFTSSFLQHAKAQGQPLHYPCCKHKLMIIAVCDAKFTSSIPSVAFAAVDIPFSGGTRRPLTGTCCFAAELHPLDGTRIIDVRPKEAHMLRIIAKCTDDNMLMIHVLVSPEPDL
mmetsp:Transcript_5210/g.9999  ORF Transcript_5210/g.9999 Transcript_5210/m.9999 type:complete len:118 (-) Transcript_5210:588-941(-)